MWCTSRASPALDDQADARARLLANQVVVHRRRQQQRRDRRALLVWRCDPTGPGCACPSAIAREASRHASSSAARSPAPPSATRYRPGMTCAARSGQSPSSSMWMSLASSSLSMIGNGSSIWRHDVRAWLEQVALGTDRRPTATSPALRESRRAADWSPARTTAGNSRTAAAADPTAPRAACRCPSSRSPRSRRAPSAPRRIFSSSCVYAEHLLATPHRFVAEIAVLAVGQVVQVDHAGLEPLRVRMLARPGRP